MRLLALFPAIACHRQPVPEEESPPLTPLEAFEQAAIGAGLSVQHGSFSSVSAAFCCEAVVDCLSIDPADNLGIIALPPAPSQEGPDLDTFWMWGSIDEGMSRNYRLRPDEAIVWTGPPPPNAAYSAVLAQVATRAAADETRYWVQGALGPPLTLPGADTEGAPASITLIITPDRVMDDQIRAMLLRSGFEPDTLYTVPFSSPVAKLGLGPLADTFATMFQVLEPEDPNALIDWWQDPDISVLRITKAGPVFAGEPSPYQPILARGTGTDESSLEGAVALLGLALNQHFSGWLSAPGEVLPRWRDPVACLSNLDCNDTWPTRLRTETARFTLEGSTAMLAFGVNHTRTGKSTLSNVSLVSVRSDAGVAVFDHHQMVGSAAAILPGHPAIDDLYAVVFARDCGRVTDLPCIVIPETCPGPSVDREMYLQFDDWLEPSTQAAPHESELLVPYAVKLLPLFP